MCVFHFAAELLWQGMGNYGAPRLSNFFLEDPGKYAIPCGLNEKSIKAVAEFPISFTKLEEVTDVLADLTLYINVQPAEITFVGGSEAGCVSTVSLEVVTYQLIDLPFNDSFEVAAINLFRVQSMESSSHSDHADAVSKSVENQVKAFIIEFNNDNK